MPRRMSARGAGVLGLSLAMLATAGAVVQAGGRPAPPSVRTGGTLVAESTSEPVSLDPPSGADSESLNFVEAFYDTLVQFSPNGLTLEPDLATRWTDQGNRVFTFTIRKGVRFWNGDPLTPQDVVFTLTRILNPKTGTSDLGPFLDIQGAAAYSAGKAPSVSGISLSGDTVTVRLVKPETYFLSALATPVGGIVDQRWVLAHHGQIKTQPMGTGPFIFKSWTPGQSLVMVRNPHYWQHGLPHLEKVVVQMDVNPQLEYERFLSHQVQLIGGSLSSSMQIGSAAYLSLIREPSLRRASYVRAILPQEYNFEIQPVGPLAQQKVRLAIAYALNPKAIATQMNGRIVLGGSLVPPGLVGYDPSLKPYPYDPAMARRLLREAGYGHGLSTTLVTVNDPETKNIDEVIQTELGQVGIHVTIRALSIGAYIAAVLKKGDAPLSWGFWLAQFPNGVNFMFGQFDGHSPYVIQGYNDPKVNALIEAANSASSTAVQGRLLRQAQVMVVRQDVPAVPIGYGVTDLLKAPNLMPAAAVYYAHPIYEIQWKYLWLK